METNEQSVTNRLFRSSALLLVTKVLQRSLGLVSTLILARLLTPEDFGLVAMVTIALYLFDILSVSGINEYITQKSTVSDDDLNCAWSINLILKSIVWIAFVISIPLIVKFYDNSKLYEPLFAISFVILINGFRNPATIMMERDLSYAKLFWLYIWQKVISFIVVIFIAVWYRTFWALIFGDLVSSVVFVLLSYSRFDYRPRFSLKKWKEQWKFSQWILFKGILGYGRAQIDNILVSRLFPTAEFGKYHMMRSLTVMPGTEILAPMLRPLLAAFSKIKDDEENFAYQIRVTLLVIFGFLFPIWSYMYFESRLIIKFLLGEQWLSGDIIFQNLSFLLLTFAHSYLAGNICIALGKVRSVFIYDLVSFIVIAGILMFINEMPLHTFALLRSGLEMILVLLFWVYASKLTKVNNFKVSYLLLPVIFSSLIATFSARWLMSIKYDYVLLEIALFSFYFVVIYVLVILVFYYSWFYRYPEYQRVSAILILKISALLNKLTGYQAVDKGSIDK